MNLLIGFETSGRVREAMRAAGHNAWSCDLLPSEDNSPYHIQCDILGVIDGQPWENNQGETSPDNWDGFIVHPPCTFMNGAGIHWNNRGRGWERTEQAVRFTLELVRVMGTKPYALENPVGILSTRWRKPDQIIQPYDFGEDASKKTCLWLQGLPLLKPTLLIYGRRVEWPKGSGKFVERFSNQTDSGQNRLGPSETRWKERSRTYQGIANAMAWQWFRS